MREGFDVVDAMRDGVRGRAAAWRFIRGFVAHWGRAISAGRDGYPQQTLDDTERRLGFALPAAVGEAYALLGRRRDLTSNQDTLAEPWELDFHGDALVHRWENQSVVSWGILRSDLDSPDPPVRMVDQDSNVWHPWMPTFSAACMEMVLSEWMLHDDLHGDGPFMDNGELPEGGSELLSDLYTPLALPEYPTFDVTKPGIRWFSGPGVMLREDQRCWVWLKARDEAAFDAARRVLQVDWLA